MDDVQAPLLPPSRRASRRRLSELSRMDIDGDGRATPGRGRGDTEELAASLMQVLRGWQREPPGPRGLRGFRGDLSSEATQPAACHSFDAEGSDSTGKHGSREQVSSRSQFLARASSMSGIGCGAQDAAPWWPSGTAQRAMDDLEQDADFWCNIVGVAGGVTMKHWSSGSCCEELNDVRENILEDFFDLTPERVYEVYQGLSRDENGHVSAAALGEGLRVCGLSGLADDAPERILEKTPLGCDGCLQPSHFESMLTQLKLAQLLVGGHKGTLSHVSHLSFVVGHLTVVDYNPLGARVTPIGDARVREFFFGRRAAPSVSNVGAKRDVMRWVHLPALDLTMLLSLTVKYCLHPLAVEDVIEQCRTKVDRYADHYFAAIERISLSGDATPSAPVRVQGQHVAMFLSGPPNLDTLLTVSQDDRSFGADWPGFSAHGVDPEPETAADHWVARLRRRIEAPRSRLRDRRANFLLLQVFDVCTDDLVEVAYAYTLRLGYLEAELDNKGEDVPQHWLEEMSAVRLQLAVVDRRVRAMLRALRQLELLDVTDDLVGYLRDITDHLDEVSDDTSTLVDKCGVLIQSYERVLECCQDERRQQASDRMNDTLFALTVFTTIFMPLQLIAGVYGMNFQDRDGKPTMPELLWPQGYTYFWAFTMCYLVFGGVFAYWLFNRSRTSHERRKERLLTNRQSRQRHVGPPQRLAARGAKGLLSDSL